MLAPAPYTIETVRDMRTLSATQGLHAVARHLGWEPGRVKSIGSRHGIEFIKDEPAPLKIVSPVVVPKKNPPQEIPKNVRRIRRSRTAAVKGHPRIDYTTIALSKAAMEILAKERSSSGKSVTNIVGVVVDYAVRNGKLPKLLDAALKEMSQ